jgi:hypothetical protein
MIRIVLICLALTPLGGCAWFGGLALAYQLTIATGTAAAIGGGVTAFHDCRQDGGCKAVPLPP